jgi:ribosomal protein S12 methylthiotransferase accessory factor
MTDAQALRIVFIGPSLPHDRAKTILPDADFRGPIKRGDLETISPGTVVGIVDGVFAQTLAISPGEIREAIGNGIAVYGAASMGALRAAEVSTMVGVGRVYEMYRTGVIERDDEVAVLMNSETHEPLTEPLVNVRFAVERLVRTGTLNRIDGAAIIDACKSLHYTERTYRKILSLSRLAANKDLDDIIKLLRNFDLKRDDAQLLLETLSTAKPLSQPTGPRQPYVQRASEQYKRVKLREDSLAPVMIWESGDSVQFSDLTRFLKVTGTFETYARNAIGRMAAAGASLDPSAPPGIANELRHIATASQSLLDGIRAQWGWESPEEAHVTMLDLGLGLEDVADSLEAEGSIGQLIRSFASNPSEEFSKAIRTELWLNELSLKRETLRLGALEFYAKEGTRAGPATDEEIRDAQRTVARLRGAFRWGTVKTSLDALGVPPAELDQIVHGIAFARRAALPVIEMMDRPLTAVSSKPRAGYWRSLGVGLECSPKAEKSARFSLDEGDATAVAEAIARQMGVVRIGLVGELDTLGIYIAQAFGERSGWSSSFSSGKAETREGARVGSIMEEVEIHAQDAYRPQEQIRTSFAKADSSLTLVNPHDLGLPYDSGYSEGVEIDWSPCLDLVSCRTVYVPLACLCGDRQTHDVFYSPRLGGKIFSSSGLGSGFTLAEAIVHAGAEYIERHAYRLAELELDNPGGVGIRQFRFVDQRSLPEAPARIVQKYHRAGISVRILDITSDIAVPTFFTRIFDDLFEGGHSVSADGFACHPNPEVAVTMALLESAQTRGGYIAGGREDFSLRARSLGRHERPRTAVPRSQTFWFSNDRPVRPLGETKAFVCRDILDELEWMVDQVTAAGFPMFLIANYTIPRIHPAHAVRVLIPGLETTNPLFTGRRARATVLRDILPSVSHEG